MKKFALAAAALASVFSTTAMAAPVYNSQNTHVVQQQRNDNGRNNGVYRQQVRQTATPRHWTKGERFDSRQARNYRVIAQPRANGLRAAPRGQRWVQSGNDAVLIGITSGLSRQSSPTSSASDHNPKKGPGAFRAGVFSRHRKFVSREPCPATRTS